MRKIMFQRIVLILSVFIPQIIFSQNIRYVNQNVSGGLQNGTSWENAYIDLQEALQIAQPNDQIWVAEGIYYPTATLDRTISFELKRGVKLLGGFHGTEHQAGERNPEIYQSRLSGNIGNLASSSDNSIHVVKGRGLDINTLVDGLVISDGYSVGVDNMPSDAYGAGLYLLGAPDITQGGVLIANCRFENNHAGGAGGGMAIITDDTDDPDFVNVWCNPVLRNCVFEANKANVIGGALLKEGETGIQDTFFLDHCRFLNNYVTVYDGGAIFFSHSGSSNIVMVQSRFENNTSKGGVGGGFSLSSSPPGGFTTTLWLEDCLFKKNEATEGGGFMFDNLYYPQPDIIFNLTVKGCIFEGNIARTGDGSAFLITNANNGVSNAEIKDCLFRNNLTRTNYTTAVLSEDESISNVLVENSTFFENFNTLNPLTYCAAFSASGGKEVHTRINNCIFAYNGAAIYAGGFEQGQVLTEITNCTFFHNGKQPFGKRWFPSFQNPGNPNYNIMDFYNCIIWEPGNITDLFYNNYPNTINNHWFHLNYCSLHDVPPGSIPNFTEVYRGPVFNFYPAFTDTLALDFSLKDCSPAINRGSNDYATNAGLLTDVVGAERIRFDTVDLGAFEHPKACVISRAVNPFILEDLILSPNPSKSGLLSFQLPTVEKPEGDLKIFAENGRLLYETKIPVAPSNSLYLNQIPSGKHLVYLKIGDHTYWGKWILVE